MPRPCVPSHLILHCARRFRALGELLGPLRSRRDAAGAGADAARPAARGGDDLGAYLPTLQLVHELELAVQATQVYFQFQCGPPARTCSSSSTQCGPPARTCSLSSTQCGRPARTPSFKCGRPPSFNVISNAAHKCIFYNETDK